MTLNFVFLGAAAALFVAPLAPLAAAESSPAAAVAAVTSARFPNADTVVLTSDQTIEVNAEGGYVRRSFSRTRILTEEGRKESQSFSLDFNRAYGSTKFTALKIVKADGRVVELDPVKQSAEQQDPSSASANIYDPNDRRLTLSIPGLEIGDTLEVAYEQAEPKARMKGCYADIMTFESTTPVLHSRYRMVTPKSLPLVRIVAKGGDASGIRHVRTEKGDSIEYVWEAGETPQMLPEPMMPAPHLCTLRILVSTVPDWQTISRWYAELCEPHLKSSPAIKAKVEELLAGVTDREERLKRVYRFVSQEIRYMGIISETDAPGYEPHDVAMTFDKRYGVCRDKAALLAVMLREAGYDAHPVLILAGGDHLDVEVPQPYFNHAITAVREPDGSFRLMDSTDENTKDPFPAYLSNCSYLVAHPKGEGLHVAPVPDAAAHLLTGETSVTVRKDGSATGESLLQFNGLTDTVYRSMFSQARPEDIRRHAQASLSRVLPGVRVTAVELRPQDVQDTTQPLSLSIRFDVAEYFSRRDGKAFLRTPSVAALYGIVDRQLGAATSLEARRFPVKLDYISGVKERVSVSLPAEFGDTLSLPDDLRLKNDAFAFARTVRRDGDKLTAECDMRIRGLEIPVAGYPAVRGDLEKIQSASRKLSLLAIADEARPDTRVLHRKLSLDIRSAGAFELKVEERRRILTYAGKKENAEVKLGWNACDAEPKLLKAVVRDTAGHEYAVGPAEINVLDAGWASSAPRYTPSRTKVISLPKVEVDSEIDLAYTLSRSGLPSVTWQGVFADTDRVDCDEVEITAPAEMALYFRNRADAKVEVRDGRVHVKASRKVTPTVPEAHMPDAAEWAPSVLISTLRDESSYAALVRPVLDAKARPDDAVRRKARELLDGAPEGEAARLRVLRDFVAKSIRAAGPVWGEIPPAGFSGAAPTLADGYGAETDRQLLFCALARAAGFAADPVVLATDEARVARRQYGEPLSPGFFDTVGTRVKLRDGIVDFAYLDEYAHPLVNVSPGGLVLDLISGRASAVTPPVGLGNSTSSQYRLTLHEDGAADVRHTRVITGEGATSFSRQIGMMRPEERKRYEHGVFQSLARDAKPKGEPELRPGQPARLAYEATIPSFLITQGRYAYFNLPQAPTEIFGGASEFARRQPYAIDGASRERLVWEVELPKGWKPSGESPDLEWTGPAGCGTVSLRRRSGVDAMGARRLTVTFETALKPADISPAAYPALVELNRRLSSGDAWRILLEKDEAAEKPAR